MGYISYLLYKKQNIVFLENGDKYDGQWKNDNPHGHGVYTWSNGKKYDGEWKDGIRHGHGVWTGVDGRKYDGEWKDGKKHGHGVYTWVDGGKYDGNWKNGRKYGIFKIYDDEHYRYEYYINGEINKEKTKELNKKIEKFTLTKILSKYFGGDCYAGEMLKSIGY